MAIIACRSKAKSSHDYIIVVSIPIPNCSTKSLDRGHLFDVQLIRSKRTFNSYRLWIIFDVYDREYNDNGYTYIHI